MTKQSRRQRSDAEAVLDDESPATEEETRAALLDRSNRDAAPILKGFVQNHNQKLANRAAPLSVFVKNGDERGLKAFLFLHAFISSGKEGWETTLPLAVWARVFDTTLNAEPRSASTAATKLLTRLESRKLITRERSGRSRKIKVTLLRPDGSGATYARPVGASREERFLNLSHRFWTEGWYRQLDLPATAMLLVALHEKPGFELVAERVPEWYGWSTDTAERGLKTLQQHGLIVVEKRVRKAPLSPTGLTVRNAYTLAGPFAPVRREATTSKGRRKRRGKPSVVRGPRRAKAAAS